MELPDGVAGLDRIVSKTAPRKEKELVPNWSLLQFSP